MRGKHFLLIPAAALLLASVGLTANTNADKAADNSGTKKAAVEEKSPNEIHWLRYDEALKKARKENKHVLVDFTATWCGWCKKMDRDTFSKPEIIKMINDYFVPAQVWHGKQDTLDIDGYKITEMDLARTEFGIRSYPTFWFVSPNGDKIGPVSGYYPPEPFMKALEYVKDRRYEEQRAKADTTSRQ